MPEIFDKTHKAEGKRVTINPITRLEGEAKIEIFLDETACHLGHERWASPVI